MIRRRTRQRRQRLILLALGLALGCTAACGTSRPSLGAGYQAEPTGPMTMTVHAVDVEGRTIELITGTGLALRLVRMPLDAACHIRLAGADAKLADLKPGCYVRLAYRGSGDSLVLVAIEASPPGEAPAKP